MALELDHVIVCVPDLAAAAEVFEEERGLKSIEGGRHTGQGTANRLVPLGDTYIELIGVVDLEEARTSPLGNWVLQRATLPGADGVCLRTDELDGLVSRLDLDSMEMSRVRPDGVVMSWRVAGLARALTANLPFFIEWRIPDHLHPGRAEVDHPIGAARLEQVVLRGDLEAMNAWAPEASGLTYAPGEPGVSFELEIL